MARSQFITGRRLLRLAGLRPSSGARQRAVKFQYPPKYGISFACRNAKMERKNVMPFILIIYVPNRNSGRSFRLNYTGIKRGIGGYALGSKSR